MTISNQPPCLSRRPPDGITIDIAGHADPDIVQTQVTRILSLDHDGRAWPDIIRKDRVLERITDQVGMLRPVLFASPYEAVCWAIIGNRVRITQAAAIKANMAKELGTSMEIDNREVHAFPGPETLLALESFAGLTQRKIGYLHGIADAALNGYFAPELLRSPGPEAVLEHLKEIKGIGPFGAELILIRGTGTVDVAPTSEPRLARAISLAYRVSETDETAIRAIIDSWSPFRTWASVLLRSFLELETHEISNR